MDDEEIALGFRCVAAPVRDHCGEVVAEVSTTDVASQLPLERVDQVAALLTQACRDISTSLVFRG